MNPRPLTAALSLGISFFLTGCSVNARFYPVQGPIASQSPTSMYVVRCTAHPPTSLTVSGFIADEKVTGTLIRTLPALKHVPNVPVPPPMTSEWDAIYGSGTYTAHVLGSGQDARGVLAGSKGTTFRVELHAPNGAASGGLEGVAEDDKGNLYKVAF